MRTDVKIGFVVGLCVVVGWVAWLLLSPGGQDEATTDGDRTEANIDNDQPGGDPFERPQDPVDDPDRDPILAGTGDDTDIFGDPSETDTIGDPRPAGGVDPAGSDREDDPGPLAMGDPGADVLGRTDTLGGTTEPDPAETDTLGPAEDPDREIPSFVGPGSDEDDVIRPRLDTLGGTDTLGGADTLGGTDTLDRTDTLGGSDGTGSDLVIWHEVRPNETLSSISQSFYGSTRYWKKILEANPGATQMIRPGQRLRIPPRSEVVAGSSGGESGSDGEPLSVPSGWKTHKIRPRDTLSEISTRFYGTSRHWDKIAQANPGINPRSLSVGEVLRIPPAPADTSPVAGTTTGPSEAPISVPAGWKVHVVQQNDILGDISKKYYGTTRYWPLIQEKNPGINPKNLRIGQQLRIPPPPSGDELIPVPSGGSDTAGSDEFPVPDMSGLEL